MVGIISVVIGGHFGGGDHFDGGDHFGGGTEVQQVAFYAISRTGEAPYFEISLLYQTMP